MNLRTQAISTAIHEAIGEASMCWNPRPTGVFDSTHAIKVAEGLTVKLEDLLTCNCYEPGRVTGSLDGTPCPQHGERMPKQASAPA